MRSRSRRSSIAALAFLACAAAAFAVEQIKCAECGMLVDPNAPFSAKIVTGSDVQYFCDIGDLLLHLRDEKPAAGSAMVRDHRSGSWINAAEAFFVYAPLRFTTPMGWSIAAFKARGDAVEHGTPVTLSEIMKRVAK